MIESNGERNERVMERPEKKTARVREWGRERESDEDEWDEKIDLDERYNACASMEMEIRGM